jgi:signal transduction histidine kinase
MISLHEFFQLNRELILFVYGLGFFILGFAIILQARQSSRLDLARSLQWLAAFGITHAFNEWGDLFIPIQAGYLSQVALRALNVLQLILLAVSFACLFEFGVAVLNPSGRARWLHSLAGGLLLGWTFLVFFFLLPLVPDKLVWHDTANALARYLIGFPGGMLAAYGLRLHTLQRIKPINVPSIVRNLQIAGISLGIYALLGGLIPPPVPFFPGSLLNTESFEQIVGVPAVVFRSLISLIIAVAVIRALEVFDLETERRIEALEQGQIIKAEHERLARELHDGAIQKVYTAGLLVESTARLAQPESELSSRLGRAIVVLNDAVADLRRNLTELQAEAQPSAEPLSGLLKSLAQDPHYNTLVNISLELDLPEAGALSPIRSGHVLAICNEALANIVRHARARNVKMIARDLGERLQILIRDDGVGLSPQVRAGYGMRNMRDRARLLNGRLDFSGSPNKGTTMSFEVPWID